MDEWVLLHSWSTAFLLDLLKDERLNAIGNTIIFKTVIKIHWAVVCVWNIVIHTMVQWPECVIISNGQQTGDIHRDDELELPV